MSFNGSPKSPKAEKPPFPESTSEIDPYQEFETLIENGAWLPEIGEKLDTLFELYQDDLYMIYLTYKESGLVSELPEYEHQLFDWLKDKFKEESN